MCVRVGVVFSTNTLSAFKSPTIVCNPVKVFAPVNLFAELSFAEELNKSST